MGAEMEMGKGSGFEKVEVVQRLDNNKLLKVSEIQRMRVGKCWPDLGPDWPLRALESELAKSNHALASWPAGVTHCHWPIMRWVVLKPIPSPSPVAIPIAVRNKGDRMCRALWAGNSEITFDCSAHKQVWLLRNTGIEIKKWRLRRDTWNICSPYRISTQKPPLWVAKTKLEYREYEAHTHTDRHGSNHRS